MLNIATIALAMFALGIMIFVHETGHYFAGKWLGFDIHEYSIGFGPKLLGREKNGTKFSLRAIPFGGYVAFDDEKNVELGELSFDKKPIWKRLIVVCAGSAMNIFLAYILVVILLATYGDGSAIPIIAEVQEGTPAFEAGLLEGDEFVKYDGIDIDGDYDKLGDAIVNGDIEPTEVIVLREDQQVTLSVTPYYNETENRNMIGITPKAAVVVYSFVESLGEGFKVTGRLINELINFLGKLVFKGEGAKDVSGVVGAVAIMSDVAQSQDFATFLYMIAFISINLGVFNLLPIPPTDGAKVVMYAVEGISGKKISMEIQMKIQLAGFILFAGLFVLLTYRDIVRIVTGG